MSGKQVIVTIEHEKVDDVQTTIELLKSLGLKIDSTQQILSATYIHGTVEEEITSPAQEGVHWEEAGWQREN